MAMFATTVYIINCPYTSHLSLNNLRPQEDPEQVVQLKLISSKLSGTLAQLVAIVVCMYACTDTLQAQATTGALKLNEASSKAPPQLGINGGNRTTGVNNTASKTNQAPVMPGANQPGQNPSKPTNPSPNQKTPQATLKPKAATGAVRPGKNASQSEEDRKPAGAEGLVRREVYSSRKILWKRSDLPNTTGTGNKPTSPQEDNSDHIKSGDKNHSSKGNVDKKLDGFSGGLKKRKMMSKMGGGGGGLKSKMGGGGSSGGGGGLKSMMGGLKSMMGGEGGGGGLKSMMEGISGAFGGLGDMVSLMGMMGEEGL
ncbi:hypothetical protein PGT21_017338 [Puccinia graminis f. sp. tritici]|uniref:Uncharacterized protein n=1 Tax=Puccinia graminis f. sp. tritici TaxID=56615 RepID=A0A5B0NE83_PUCGR|nr:hypothetical protein PGT21_017338 [Puccinia graminis f. sp. tritici]